MPYATIYQSPMLAYPYAPCPHIAYPYATIYQTTMLAYPYAPCPHIAYPMLPLSIKATCNKPLKIQQICTLERMPMPSMSISLCLALAMLYASINHATMPAYNLHLCPHLASMYRITIKWHNYMIIINIIIIIIIMNMLFCLFVGWYFGGLE